jgi:CRISPR-associated protein Csy2
VNSQKNNIDPNSEALLILPNIRIQNANAISSPLTWGFPAISGFLGLMTALERRLGSDAGINFRAIGVICHHFEPQVTSGGFTHTFHQTRNPVSKDGNTAAIVEEGRVHLELTLVFDALISSNQSNEKSRLILAERSLHLLQQMRVAGGTIFENFSLTQRKNSSPLLLLVPDDPDQQYIQFRRLARQWLPGFALVSRDDLLDKRFSEIKELNANATLLDAWLDLSSWNHRAFKTTNDNTEIINWVTDHRPGWIVPIPIGYAGLNKLHPPGAVHGARDMETPFCFVEPILSIGQWISPLRLNGLDDLLWYSQTEEKNDKYIYRCQNDYTPPNQ